MQNHSPNRAKKNNLKEDESRLQLNHNHPCKVGPDYEERHTYFNFISFFLEDIILLWIN